MFFFIKNLKLEWGVGGGGWGRGGTLPTSLSGTFLQKDVVNQCLEFGEEAVRTRIHFEQKK